MLTRSFSVLVTALVAAASLAVASAMATDDPAPPAKPPAQGGKPPAQGSQPPVQAGPLACIDSKRPVSHLSANWKIGFRNGVLRGTATDRGCGSGGGGTLRRVSVSVQRKVGHRCQSLQSNGRLGHVSNCSTKWLPAKGTKTWTFRLSHKLPRGQYFVSTRAVDSAGNVEGRGATSRH